MFINYTGAHHDKLGEMIGQLSEALTGVKHEQEYMEIRERIHRDSEYIKLVLNRSIFFVWLTQVAWPHGTIGFISLST